MNWFRRRRKPNDRNEVEEVSELLDSYSERTTVEEPDGSRVVFVPGNVIDNLRDRMERVILDPLVEIAIEDFISQEESALMFSSGLGPALIEATAEHGALLARRELPMSIATHRIPAEFDLVAQFGLHGISPQMQQVGRELYNDACKTGTEVHLADYTDDVLNVEQQGEVFITVLMLALVKLVNGVEELRKG